VRASKAVPMKSPRILKVHPWLHVLATVSFFLSPEAGHSQTSDQVNANNNPLTPAISLNLQDYWAPSLYDSNASTNAALLRAVLPHQLGGMQQIARGTLPIVTAPSVSGNGNTTGLGDFNLIDVAMFKTRYFTIGVGPQLTIPTATDRALGTGKWQGGLAAVVIAPQSWGLVGGLVTWQHSFAGQSDRPTQNNLAVQPFFVYNLPHGVYFRSSAVWNFAVAQNTYAIPIGAGVGKVIATSDGTTINIFAEPQWTVAHEGRGQPKFQVFAGVTLQFPPKKKS
jgi:hypothetical protein